MTIDRNALVERVAAIISGAPFPGTRSRTKARAVLDAILPEVQAQTLEDTADRLDYLAGHIGKGLADATTLRQFAANFRKGASDE